MIRFARPPCPASLAATAEGATEAVETTVESGQKLTFDAKIYGASDVKAALRTAQHGKCAFCESSVSQVAYGDVEHFRPKAAWCQADEPLTRPGYWWLAYAWTNLLFACEICNRRFKRSAFPLRDPAGRARCPDDDLAIEEPLFLDPTVDDPEAHIGWHGPDPVALTERGRATIAALDLACLRDDVHRRALRDECAKQHELVTTLLGVRTEVPPTVRAEIDALLARLTGPGAAYLAMTRAVL